MPTDNDILYGMDKIRPVLGNASEMTVMKWKKEYASFPIRKLCGQWVSHRGELGEWWRKFVIGEVDNRDYEETTDFKTGQRVAVKKKVVPKRRKNKS